jgi:hypothetical protein
MTKYRYADNEHAERPTRGENHVPGGTAHRRGSQEASALGDKPHLSAMPRLFLSPPNTGMVQRLDFHVQTALVEKIMHRFGAIPQSAVIVDNDEARW